jgi:hypothetical protein
MEVLSHILRERILERKKVRKLLEEVYRRHALQPLRGRAWPNDIWDKEIATLYALAKYALALDQEDPDTFRTIFSVEEAYEEAAEVILSSRDEDEKVKLVGFILGGSIESNNLARMFRVILTEVLLGFRSEHDIERLLRETAKLFPDHIDTVRKYARYYIALRTAEAIAAGLIRNRITKEAYKQALAARIGLSRILPDDDYIGYIARTLYSVHSRKLESILSLEKRQQTSSRK